MASGSMSPVGAQCHIQVWHGTECWLPSSSRFSLLCPALSLPQRLTVWTLATGFLNLWLLGVLSPWRQMQGAQDLNFPASFLRGGHRLHAWLHKMPCSSQSALFLSFWALASPSSSCPCSLVVGGALLNPRTLGELLVGLKEQLQERRASTGWKEADSEPGKHPHGPGVSPGFPLALRS